MDTLFYVHVLKYYNRGTEALLSTVDCPYPENIADRDFGVRVAHVAIDYLSLASLGTEFNVSATPTVRESSMVFDAAGAADGKAVFRSH